MTLQLKTISKVRFEALAGYCRLPETRLHSEEVGWFEAEDEAVLVAVVRDFEDGDFAAILLARDLKERYRFVRIGKFLRSYDKVVANVPTLVSEVMSDLDTERVQGDEKGKPVDFFTPVVPIEKLHPDFEKLTTREEYSPALELIKPMMRWYDHTDKNFIEQFQTTGFDARLWELYLFAMLVESGYALEKDSNIPDFSARCPFAQICVEATSVNPSVDGRGRPLPPPPVQTPEQLRAFQKHYMPIRFAGPLTTKLSKKYWERQNVQGKPLLFAIQDFHAPASMTLSRSALPIYLYGIDWDAHHDAVGNLVIVPKKVESHKWGTKEPVPSGFFNHPGAENVSAVITNASATVSKFTRMGVLAGFGSKRVRLIRRGMAANPAPNSAAPLYFVHDVNSPDYSETWIEGLDVYHNPNAKLPLDPTLLPGAAHHTLRDDGQLQTLAPDWHPFSSTTHIVVPR